MINEVDIKIEINDGEIEILGTMTVRALAHLKEAVEDIADRIEDEASDNAPRDQDPDAYSWRLRPGINRELWEHPVDREDVTLGTLTDLPLIGGGFTLRGAGGRFAKGGNILPVSLTGRTIANIKISVTNKIPYAIWVHEGTAAHGPVNKDFMVYKSFGKWHKRTLVAGQDPQPYLTKAARDVENGYLQERIFLLRQEIKNSI